MKNLLFAILLSPLLSFAQTPPKVSLIQDKLDTVLGFLIICDTGYVRADQVSIYTEYEETKNIQPGKLPKLTREIGSVKHRIPYVFWLRGYAVYKVGVPPGMASPIGYLDGDLKPLGKELFVILH